MMARLIMAVLVVMNSLAGFTGACRADCAVKAPITACCCSMPEDDGESAACPCCAHAAPSAPASVPLPPATADLTKFVHVDSGLSGAVDAMPFDREPLIGGRTAFVYPSGACRRAMLCVRLT